MLHELELSKDSGTKAFQRSVFVNPVVMETELNVATGTMLPSNSWVLWCVKWRRCAMKMEGWWEDVEFAVESSSFCIFILLKCQQSFWVNVVLFKWQEAFTLVSPSFAYCYKTKIKTIPEHYVNSNTIQKIHGSFLQYSSEICYSNFKSDLKLNRVILYAVIQCEFDEKHWITSKSGRPAPNPGP